MQHTEDSSIKSMSKSMAIVMIFMMTSKVTGFLRETVLAANFGRNAMTDAYKVAFELPCLFLSIVIAAISATFIPVYNSRLQKGEKEAAHFVNNLYTMGMALSVLISLVTLLFIDQLAVWMMPDAAPETQRLTVELARMMMPMGIFVFLHRLTTAYLQAKFHFAVPALAPLFGNLCILGSIVISRGRSIEIVAIGSLVGMMMQFIVQVPSALRADLRYKPTFDVRESGMREVAMLMIPVIIASAFDSLYIVFDRMITSGNPGDITALDYGNRVSTMVSAVLLSTIATVLYPNLVRDADDRARYQRHLILGINLNILIALPAMTALAILRQPLTRLIYQRGAFTAADTLVTAGTLSCYGVGLLGVGIRELCNRGFYALKDVRVPTWIGVGAVLLNISLNFALYPVWGSSGVAMATAISASMSGLLLLVLLRKRIGGLGGSAVYVCLCKAALSAAVMGGMLLAAQRFLPLEAFAGKKFLLVMGGLMVGGCLLYGVMLYVLKTKELRVILRFVRERLPGGRTQGA